VRLVLLTVLLMTHLLSCAAISHDESVHVHGTTAATLATQFEQLPSPNDLPQPPQCDMWVVPACPPIDESHHELVEHRHGVHVLASPPEFADRPVIRRVSAERPVNCVLCLWRQ
jgi:hypothetical protein